MPMDQSLMPGMGGSLVMILGIIIVIAAIVAIVSVVRSSSRSKRESRNDIAILDERYAKGELTDQEYRRKKLMLED
ncbi:SHOCT domain-containing protein [Bacillus daqingensis]|uniref:SHOCT domain-containing protein n=1 Tax=Bacillus daqingensis TaxID=872396 RepID=A0ABV9NVF6_9BACI